MNTFFIDESVKQLLCLAYSLNQVLACAGAWLKQQTRISPLSFCNAAVRLNMDATHAGLGGTHCMSAVIAAQVQAGPLPLLSQQQALAAQRRA